MTLIVQKYGGSSLATPGHIKRVASRLVEERKSGKQVVVVVSAIGDTTDHLVKLASEVCKDPPEREMDMLLSVGERISIALLAMAISHLGQHAISFTGSQIGIITDNRHTQAKILEIRGTRLQEALNKGQIVIVAGFQGVSVNKEITTLGRGGSDTTAIALAAALKADRCEIMKDVDGIFVAEPTLIPGAKLNKTLSYEEMLLMTHSGSGVLKTESVELARAHQIKIAVGSSFSGKIGTIITDRSLESANISGIVGQKELCALSLQSDSSLLLRAVNLFLAEIRLKTHLYFFASGKIHIVLSQKYQEQMLTFIRESLGVTDENGFSLQSGMGLIAIIGQGLSFSSALSKKILRTIQKLKIYYSLLQINPLQISLVVKGSDVDGLVQKLYRELVAK